MISQDIFALYGISHLHITFSISKDIIHLIFLQVTPDLNPSIQLLYNPDENLTVEHPGQFQPGKVTKYNTSLSILIRQAVFGQCLIKIKTINSFSMLGTEKDVLGIGANL